MPVHYVKHYPFFDKHFDNHSEGLTVLFFDPVMERSAVPIGDRFRRIDAGLRGNADVFVIRFGSDNELGTYLDDSVFRALVRDTPHITWGQHITKDTT